MKISSYNSNYAIQKQPNFKANITKIDSKAKKFLSLINDGDSFLTSLRLHKPEIQEIKLAGKDLNIALSANDELSELHVITSLKENPGSTFFSIITKKDLSPNLSSNLFSDSTTKHLEAFRKAIQRGIHQIKKSIEFKTKEVDLSSKFLLQDFGISKPIEDTPPLESFISVYDF